MNFDTEATRLYKLSKEDSFYKEILPKQLNSFSKEEFKKLIASSFRICPKIYLNLFMLGSYKYWKSFNLEDWKDIYTSIKQDIDALWSYLPFIYQLLDINLFDTLLLDDEVKTEIKEYIISVFLGENNRINKKAEQMYNTREAVLKNYGIDFTHL